MAEFKYTPLEQQGLGRYWNNTNIGSANQAGNAVANMVSGYDSLGNPIFAEWVTPEAFSASQNALTNDVVNAFKADPNAFKSGLGNKIGLTNAVGSTGGNNTFLGMDKGTMQGLGSLFSVGKGLFDISNSRKQLGLAKDAWKAENARANELMAMNREKYNTYKADKARLNTGYTNG
jgi:hypothetical protein